MKEYPQLWINNDPNVSLLYSSKNPNSISVITRGPNNKKGIGELDPYPIDSLIRQTRTQDAIASLVIYGIIKIAGLLINKATPWLIEKFNSKDIASQLDNDAPEINKIGSQSLQEQFESKDFDKNDVLDQIKTRDLSKNSNMNQLFIDIENLYYRNYFDTLKNNNDFYMNSIKYIIDILILSNMIREIRNAQFRNLYPNQINEYKKIRKQSDVFISEMLTNNLNYIIQETKPYSNLDLRIKFKYIIGGGYFLRNAYRPAKKNIVYYAISQQTYNDII